MCLISSVGDHEMRLVGINEPAVIGVPLFNTLEMTLCLLTEFLVEFLGSLKIVSSVYACDCE